MCSFALTTARSYWWREGSRRVEPERVREAGSAEGCGPSQQLRHRGGVAAEHLGHPERVVEADEHVGDDEAALGQVAALVRHRHGRLEPRGVLVAEVADDRLPAGLGLLERDQARAAADERVASQPALLDGLEQEARATALAQPEVGPERGQQVG